MNVLTLKEIVTLQNDLQRTKMLLQMANETIKVMRGTSERDWATIVRLVAGRGS